MQTLSKNYLPSFVAACIKHYSEQVPLVVLEKYSLQNQIGEDTPRTFIALCQDDKVVNPKSSLLYYNSLLDKGIKAEMYIFPTGGHGWGFLNEEISGRKDGLAGYRNIFGECLGKFLDEVKK